VIVADRVPPEGASRFPEEVRSLAAEVGFLLASDEEFVRRVSKFERSGDGALVASLGSPHVDFLIPAHTRAERLREGEAALSDAISREPSRPPTVVDLRFADQVVVRRNRNH
jgi:hypothetical protein